MAGLLRNRADRTQLFLAATGPFVLLFPFLVSFNFVVEIALWIVVWFCLCRHNHILHNHVHYPFTNSKRVNRLIGLMLGFCTGVTVGNWKLTHVHGHHVEHKIGHLRSREFTRLLSVNGNAAFSVRAGLAHAIRTAPLQWFLPLRVMLSGAFGAPSMRRKFFRFYLGEFFLIYGIVAVASYCNPAKGIAYFGLMYSLVYLLSRYICYATHVASIGGSKYSVANVCLHPKYNAMFWNFGFHVAHHVRPAAHWTALPALYADLGVHEESDAVLVQTNVVGLFMPTTFAWQRIADPKA
jgi:beta-carotene hydroxylase